MLGKFTDAISILTERRTTMGIEEFLLDQAKREGRKEGMTEKEFEKNITFSRNLLSSIDMSISKIAQLVDVTEEFVLVINSKLK